MQIWRRCEKNGHMVAVVSIPHNLFDSPTQRFSELWFLAKSSLIKCKLDICECAVSSKKMVEKYDLNEKIHIIKIFDIEDEGARNLLRYLTHYAGGKEKSKKRKELLEKAEGVCPKSYFGKIAELQEFQCYFCFDQLYTRDDIGQGFPFGKKIEWDHLTPISKGGTKWPSNMALVCLTCNRLKGDKTEDGFWEWLHCQAIKQSNVANRFRSVKRKQEKRVNQAKIKMSLDDELK